MRLSKMITLTGVTALMLSFQNCGSPVVFGETKMSLAAVDFDGAEDNYNDNEIIGSPQLPENPESSPAPENGSELPPPEDVTQNETMPSDDGSNEQPPSYSPPGQNRPPHEVSDEDDDEEGGSGDYVACILEGPGRSQKLGLVESQLGQVRAVSQSVCVTERACLELVSQVLPVQGAYSRGYCAHNPNVVRLTDDQVEALLVQ